MASSEIKPNAWFDRWVVKYENRIRPVISLVRRTFIEEGSLYYDPLRPVHVGKTSAKAGLALTARRITIPNTIVARSHGANAVDSFQRVVLFMKN